jgi:hypothetical protein
VSSQHGDPGVVFSFSAFKHDVSGHSPPSVRHLSYPVRYRSSNNTTRICMHGKAVRENPITDKAGRSAGGILRAATLLEILAMAHHPSVGTPDIAQAAL